MGINTFVTMLIVGLLIYWLGYYVGKAIQMSHDTDEIIEIRCIAMDKVDRLRESIKESYIDGEELITWIDDASHGGESEMLPTKRQIIREIKRMMAERM